MKLGLSLQNRSTGCLSDLALTRSSIVSIKTRSIRKRIWFKTLDRLERGFVDLTIRWVDKVRNEAMAKVLVRILEKLVHQLEFNMVRALSTGKEAAFRASFLAVEWGNNEAYSWRFDKAFWIGLSRTVSTFGA